MRLNSGFLAPLVLILSIGLCMHVPSFALCANTQKTFSNPTPTFFKTPFSYYTEQQDLPLALTQFARSQGYGVSISPYISGTLSGRFNNVDPNTFLAGMQSAFGVNWYVLENIIYFYHEAENTRAFITPRAMSSSQMYALLKNAHIFSPQLIPQQNNTMIVVSGPQSYINQITQAALNFEQTQVSDIVMEVFPLKHAWADDISVTSLDQTITIPGVATILRAMVLGVQQSPATIVQQAVTVESLTGDGLAKLGQVEEEEEAPKDKEQTAVNIMADSRVNAVIINDAKYRMPYYAKVIQDLDKPVELVEIHAAIVDIDSSYNRDLGITFQGGYESGNVTGSGDISGGDSFNTTNTQGSPVAGFGLSTIYTHGANFFLSRIEALEEDGEARILGRPSVLTADNIQASLENTSTYYIQVEGTDVVDLFKVEAGTVLRVTPHIIRDEFGRASIKLAVHVQDNQSDSDSTESVGALPPIKQTKINTQAVVGEGQSLLIGGYYYEQKTDSESGVPGLKNIPVIGNLFKSKSKKTQRMERLILITPRIIDYNNIPAIPAHLDEPSFSRSPTQNHYEEREPMVNNQSGGGCSRKSPTVQNPDYNTQNNSNTVITTPINSGSENQTPAQTNYYLVNPNQSMHLPPSTQLNSTTQNTHSGIMPPSQQIIIQNALHRDEQILNNSTGLNE